MGSSFGHSWSEIEDEAFRSEKRIAELEALLKARPEAVYKENVRLREALSDVRAALQEADGLTTKARNIARDALHKADAK